jgi:hypothetical protein
MSWLSGARTRMQLLFRRRAAESRIDEEVAFHLEMETDRLIREERLSPDEARRRARATFGGVTQHTETLKEGRGLAWLGGMSLDLKLGGRMLLKYPGLTLVGGLAMAFAIWMGAMTFEMVNMLMNPTLPLPGGDRIVQLRNWDVEKNDQEPRAFYDFQVWRGALSRVTDIGAWHDEAINLKASDGDIRSTNVAAISASAFRVASGIPGSNARRGGREPRRAASDRTRLRYLAHPLRERLGGHRPTSSARRLVRHRGRRHARGIPVSGGARPVDAAQVVRHRRAARGARDLDLRSTRARRLTRGRTG